MTDLTGKISTALFILAQGSGFLTLIIATVIVIVLGMGMPTPAVYALASVLAAPALLALDVPLLPAHLFIVYFASMSAITPPVAVAAFAAGTIANANPLAIAVQCCRLAIVAFIIPYIFIYNTGVLMIGSAANIAFSVVTATAGVVALVCAQEGFIARPIGAAARIALTALGLALLAGEPLLALLLGR